MSKPDLRSNAWSFTTLKIQCKKQNESILESGIPLQKAFKASKFSAHCIKCIGRIGCLSFYNYNFLHGKNNQSNHNYRFLHVSHPCNYGLIAFLAANQTKVILHSM